MLEELYLRAFTIGEEFDEEYLSDIPAIKHLRLFTFRRPVTFFVGENGSGKSTLLEALAIQCGFNPEGGIRNFNFATREWAVFIRQYCVISLETAWQGSCRFPFHQRIQRDKAHQIIAYM